MTKVLLIGVLLLSTLALAQTPDADPGTMPAATLALIRADLEARYPNNAKTQETLLDAQVAAYRTLRTYAADGVPSHVVDGARKVVAERYPNNFTMQKTLLDVQIGAYLFLESYAPDGIPAGVLAPLKTEVRSRYPNNYAMQKTLLEAQVSAYRKQRS